VTKTAKKREEIVNKLTAQSEETAKSLGSIKGLQTAIDSQNDIVAQLADRLKNDSSSRVSLLGAKN
jgi:hypothetical protein